MKNLLYLCASLALLGLGYYYGIDLPRRQSEKIQQENRVKACKSEWSNKFYNMKMNPMSDKEALDVQKWIEKMIDMRCQ